MATRRRTILASWHAAQRQSSRDGAITLTAASFAGYVLEAADGDLDAAHARVPSGGAPYWSRVHAALDDVANEERLLRAAGGER